MRTNLGYALVALFQLAAIAVQYLVLGALTSNQLLAVGYAVGLGLAPAGLFALALALGPAQSKVASILAGSPGGALATGGGLLLVATLALEVPLLVANGWDWPTALLVLVGSQLPAGYFCSLFTLRTLTELVNEQRVALWLDATRRTVRLAYVSEMLKTVQLALADFRELGADDPQLLAAFDEPELAAHNVTASALRLLDTQPQYVRDPELKRVYDAAGPQLRELPYAPRPERAPEADDDGDWLAELK